MKILILASNPRRDLKLNEEIRDLQNVIERSRDRERFEVEVGLAVRREDLQALLLRHEPQIVHFCGHGVGEQGLVLQDQSEQEQLVSTAALQDLFSLFAQQIECVLLNACYSETQADAIVNHINYVIGMRREILDAAAIAFSTGFYGALGYGRSIEEAYRFGCNQIHLMNLEGQQASWAEPRKLEVVGAVSAVGAVNPVGPSPLPEHLKPQIKRKQPLTVIARSAGGGAVEAFSSPEQLELPVRSRLIARAPDRQNPDRQAPDRQAPDRQAQVQQYRAQAKAFLRDRKMTPGEKFQLQQLATQLAISEALQTQIWQQLNDEIDAAKKRYRDLVADYIQEGYYPFNDETQTELKSLQDCLGLLDTEAAEISRPILEMAAQAQCHQAIAPPTPLSTIGSPALDQHTSSLTELAGLAVRLEGNSPQILEHWVEDLGNGVRLEMIVLPGGTFLMGQTEAERQAILQRFGEQDYNSYFAAEQPQHPVTLPSFGIGKCVVTQAQYQAILGENPAQFKGKDRPIEQVSWHDAVRFCTQLSQQTGRSYRLPSEAEWEYACRGGRSTPFGYGETIGVDLANYNGHYPYGSGAKGIYRKQTTAVQSFPPNPFGLYDLHGNVWEWCADRWHENYHGAPTEGSAWITGESDYRLLRGGSWDSNPWYCRSAYRDKAVPHYKGNDLGFRVVCPIG